MRRTAWSSRHAFASCEISICKISDETTDPTHRMRQPRQKACMRTATSSCMRLNAASRLPITPRQSRCSSSAPSLACLSRCIFIRVRWRACTSRAAAAALCCARSPRKLMLAAALASSRMALLIFLRCRSARFARTIRIAALRLAWLCNFVAARRRRSRRRSSSSLLRSSRALITRECRSRMRF